MDYLSVKETAINFNTSERHVQQLCDAGQIQGAKMIHGVWVIPSNASKSTDDKIISSQNLLFCFRLCKLYQR